MPAEQPAPVTAPITSNQGLADPEDLYCRQFYLGHKSGDKLYAKRLKSRATGHFAYVVSPGGNTRQEAVELESDDDLLHYVFDRGYAVRAETLPGTAARKRSGLYKASGPSIREVIRL
jgi:hypothetical protein